jgi:putative DNA primase/helicase
MKISEAWKTWKYELEKNGTIYKLLDGRYLLPTGNKYQAKDIDELFIEFFNWCKVRQIEAKNKDKCDFELFFIASCQETKKESVPTWENNEIKNFIIPFKNCLYKVMDQQRIEHTAKYITDYYLEWDYLPDATCKRFEQWLEEIIDDDFVFNDETVDIKKEAQLKKKLIAQIIIWVLADANNDLQKFVSLIGVSRGGKSTFQKLLQAIVGVKHTLSFSCNRLGDKFAISPFIGKKLACAPECDLSNQRDKKIIGEVIKGLTGQDMMEAEIKGVNRRIYFYNKAKIIISGNDDAYIPDNSGAISNRHVVLKFTKSFFGKEDRELDKKLISEIPGIINWALKNGADVLVDGFVTTQESLEHKQEIKIAMNPIHSWVEECCLIAPALKEDSINPKTVSDEAFDRYETPDRLYNCYAEWTKANGYMKPTKNMFCRRLKEILPKLNKPIHGKYFGMKLIKDFWELKNNPETHYFRY